MFNEDIFRALRIEFGEDKIEEITLIISSLYDIKYNGSKSLEAKAEYDYEREWWIKKHLNIKKK